MSTDAPALPILETHVRPPSTTEPDEPIVAMHRDALGVWWHSVGGEYVRRATPIEELLRLSPRAWKELRHHDEGSKQDAVEHLREAIARVREGVEP